MVNYHTWCKFHCRKKLNADDASTLGIWFINCLADWLFFSRSLCLCICGLDRAIRPPSLLHRWAVLEDMFCSLASAAAALTVSSKRWTSSDHPCVDNGLHPRGLRSARILIHKCCRHVRTERENTRFFFCFGGVMLNFWFFSLKLAL